MLKSAGQIAVFLICVLIAFIIGYVAGDRQFMPQNGTAQTELHYIDSTAIGLLATLEVYEATATAANDLTHVAQQLVFATQTASSPTPSNTPSATLTPSRTYTPTPTFTLTRTLTPSLTPTPTLTPDLSQTEEAARLTSTADALIERERRVTLTVRAVRNANARTATFEAAHQSIDYRELASYADRHTGEAVRVRGRVFNIIDEYSLQMWMEDSNEALIVVSRTPLSQVYPGDRIMVYGTVYGFTEGTNRFGATIRQPALTNAVLTNSIR